MGCSASIQYSNNALPYPPSPKLEHTKTQTTHSTHYCDGPDYAMPSTRAHNESLSTFNPNRKAQNAPFSKQQSLGVLGLLSKISDTSHEDLLGDKHKSPQSSRISRVWPLSPESTEKPSIFMQRASVFSKDQSSPLDPLKMTNNMYLNPDNQFNRGDSFGRRMSSNINEESYPIIGDNSDNARFGQETQEVQEVHHNYDEYKMIDKPLTADFGGNMLNFSKLQETLSQGFHRVGLKVQTSREPSNVEPYTLSLPKERLNTIGNSNKKWVEAWPDDDPSKKVEKEKFKKNIEQKFTANLLNLVRSPPKKEVALIGKKTLTEPASPSSSGIYKERLFMQDVNMRKKEQEKDTDHDEDAKDETKNMPARVSLRPTPLDMSIDRCIDKIEDDLDSGLKGLKPHTPIKRSLFSAVLDTSEIGPGPTTTSIGGGGRSHTQVIKPGQMNNDKKGTASSLMFSENNKAKNSDTTISSVVETKVLDKSVNDEGQKRINQYILGKQLGRGTFGKVKLAIDSDTGTKYAVKIVNKRKMAKNFHSKESGAYYQLQTEIAILKKMNHPNIVQLFEVIDDPNADKLYLVMALVHRGAVMSQQYWNTESLISHRNIIRASSEMSKNLRQLITQSKRMSVSGSNEDLDKNTNKDESQDSVGRVLSEDKAKSYFRDLVLGLDYLHNIANVIHRDIKPENLLVDEYDTLKISDFNISCMIEESETNKGIIKNAAGTKTYLAPEAWAGGKFRGQPLDIWAAGATLYYFLYGKPPFMAGKLQQLKELISTSEPTFPQEIPVSQEAIRLIKACLQKNPVERITLDKIMVDPWLTNNGKIKLDNHGLEKLFITEDDIRSALSRKLRTTLLIAIQLKKSSDSAKNRLRHKRTLSNSQISSSIMSVEKSHLISEEDLK